MSLLKPLDHKPGDSYNCLTRAGTICKDPDIVIDLYHREERAAPGVFRERYGHFGSISDWELDHVIYREYGGDWQHMMFRPFIVVHCVKAPTLHKTYIGIHTPQGWSLVPIE